MSTVALRIAARSWSYRVATVTASPSSRTKRTAPSPRPGRSSRARARPRRRSSGRGRASRPRGSSAAAPARMGTRQSDPGRSRWHPEEPEDRGDGERPSESFVRVVALRWGRGIGTGRVRHDLASIPSARIVRTSRARTNMQARRGPDDGNRGDSARALRHCSWLRPHAIEDRLTVRRTRCPMRRGEPVAHVDRVRQRLIRDAAMLVRAAPGAPDLILRYRLAGFGGAHMYL